MGALDLESYRTRLEEFEQTLNRELYRYYSGQKTQLEIHSIYSDYSDLFSTESIHVVTSELKNTSESLSSRRKSCRKIAEFLIDQHLDCQTAPLTQEIARFESMQTVHWEGREISLSQVPAVLKEESSAIKRYRLYECNARAQQESGLKQKKVVQLRSTAVELGFKNYRDAREWISGINYKQLLNSLDAVLRRLEDRYKEQFRVSLESTLGISSQGAGCWDLAHWLKKNDERQIFSEINLIPVVKATIEELGVQPEHPDAIVHDMDRRTGKNPRPFCIPIRVPQEIKIGLLPGSGFKQYAALLHESGHACHFAWTNSSLPAEHRIWGDRALSESYGFLLEYLIRDPQWLARMLSFTKSRDFLHFQSLFRMFLIRRYAADLCFALQLHEQNSLDNMSEIYAETMRSYTGLKYQPESWLDELPDGFESADYIRGWILECMLRQYLCSKYGKDWFGNRSAGGFLKEIWETGLLYSADELCREIGFSELDPQILAEECGLREN